MHHEEPEDFRYGTPEDATDDLGLGLVDDASQETVRRRSAPVKKWMLVVGAALVVVIGITALVLALMPRNVAGEVADAPDVTETSAGVTGGGQAVLRLSESLDAGSLELSDLPGAPDQQTYQVWVESVGGGTVSSVEVLDPKDTKDTVGFKSLDDIESVLVTTEPVDGSNEPSDTKVLEIDLPH
ncbi:MAG: anti-sigma factor [Arthrobacter sp.]|uniref:anti-sigma factor n=1 Tax=unclassified Arthrobacter TaxID=235627 RepID=UPI002651C3DC|nr:anti-sigma factor [Micrococcaceae bacterium]MDN5825310.1 anti-sigma factor [Micrococcaceae bacterium]MDN5879779.1 anti-sigma factor [Micrococcaceae bacterium]MDN5886997.1 anti-sigma factor [Micrococcaceae bacterium]MDN5905289.1 anti-sigma factor [Micrococcaceae bacterium]